jgi:hypothetical protein
MEVRGRKYYLLPQVGSICECVAIPPKLFVRRTRLSFVRFSLVEFADRELVKVDNVLINVRKHFVMRIPALFAAFRDAIAADRQSAERFALAAGTFPKRLDFKHATI